MWIEAALFFTPYIVTIGFQERSVWRNWINFIKYFVNLNLVEVISVACLWKKIILLRDLIFSKECGKFVSAPNWMISSTMEHISEGRNDWLRSQEEVPYLLIYVHISILFIALLEKHGGKICLIKFETCSKCCISKKMMEIVESKFWRNLTK